MPCLRLLLAACLGLAASLGLAAPATASTSVVEVEPGNGATVGTAPSSVVLTFATPLDPARSTATLTPPGQEERDAAARVDGERLVVDLPFGGDGDYVVGYSVASADAAAGQGVVTGSVGFTVSAGGEAPAPGGAGPWALVSTAALAGLVGVLWLTYRRWQESQ